MTTYSETIFVNGEEETLAEEVSERVYARLEALHAAYGEDIVFLSFQERLDWANGSAGAEDCRQIVEQRQQAAQLA